MECGVRSAECGVRSVEWTNEECRLWSTRSGENGKYKNMECGKKNSNEQVELALLTVLTLLFQPKSRSYFLFSFLPYTQISMFKRIQHQNCYLKGL